MNGLLNVASETSDDILWLVTAQNPSSSDTLADSPLSPYDAILLLSYGGPNKQEDVLPFLRDVVSGKNIPDSRLEVVGEHYRLFGGRSPINGENLRLLADLRAALDRRDVDTPILFGNRHWNPYTVDTLRTAIAYGARRILVVITAAYISYSGSRQYREHLAETITALEAETGVRLDVDILRAFYNDQAFVDANVNAVREAASELPVGQPLHIAYVTHSIPETMNEASGATGPTYLEQHQLVAAEVTRAVEGELGDRLLGTSLSFCSRSGSPHQPWLAPDISDRLDELKAQGVQNVVIAPIGFIADHMEVVFDLDTEAAAHADEIGLEVRRATTAGHRPEFVEGLAELMIERAAVERGHGTRRPVIGSHPMTPDVAPPNSCRQRAGVVTGLPVVAGDDD
ncbi:ferrochelatase [Pseudoclavibacter sp. CFCC 13796]|nr:ferrochelatase [Pseudoclavibacter sp. CFCC 13796]